MPLWLDLPGLRVVHACWHTRFISWLEPYLHQGRYLTKDVMTPATTEPDDLNGKDGGLPSLFKGVEALTKGIEIPLPAGHDFEDKDGLVRTRVRVRWWDEGATTYRTAAMLSPKECAFLRALLAHRRSVAAVPSCGVGGLQRREGWSSGRVSV